MTQASAPSTPAARRGPLRRLYDWVLHWADTRFAVPALCGLAFAESSFFPIPPDVLLIALAIGDRRKAFLFAAWCSLASVLGGMAGYAIGHYFWEAGLRDFFMHYVPGVTPAGFEAMRLRYEDWNVWIVFIAAFTPIPYKLITITAGVFGVDFPLFVLASACGRSARFFLVSGLIWRFGSPIKAFLDKYLGIVTVVGAAMLIGGFAAVKYMLPASPAGPVQAMQLADAQTLSGSGALTFARAAKVLDLGALTHQHGDAVFAIDRLDAADGDERYTLSIQGSNDANFAGDPVTLADCALATAATMRNPITAELPIDTERDGVSFRYLRAYVQATGTSPQIVIASVHIRWRP